MAETVLNFTNALDLNSLAQLLETDEILIELEDDLECLDEGNIKDLKVSEDSTSRKCEKIIQDNNWIEKVYQCVSSWSTFDIWSNDFGSINNYCKK